MNDSHKRIFGLILFLALGLALAAGAAAQRQAPPEYKEILAATRLPDAAARLRELERIKSAYPASVMMATINMYILTTRIELVDSLEAVLDLQKDFLAGIQGPGRMQGRLMAAAQIITHPKLKTFDAAKVTAAVLAYREAALKASTEPATFRGIAPEEQKDFTSYVMAMFDLRTAQAYLNSDDGEKALACLEGYRKKGGEPDAQYSYTLAETCALMNRVKEAYEAYLASAAENFADAAAKAKVIYTKINGKPDGFEAEFEARLKALPYHPEAFKPAPDWKGKAVLIELFTGSACPPCVGADLALDGLIEAYPSQYLAVLEYHLPIPAPDPMMNPASRARQGYYGVSSTPTVVIDGDNKIVGGAGRSGAEGKFKEYKAGIDARVNEAPGAVIKAKAGRAMDRVTVECDFGQPVTGADYYVVLVQSEEKFRGPNGLTTHKMVVRDLSVSPPGAKKATFDLAASEKNSDQYLTDFEAASLKGQPYKFPERHAKIGRLGLKVVVFAQDKQNNKVLNAVVVDVK